VSFCLSNLKCLNDMSMFLVVQFSDALQKEIKVSVVLLFFFVEQINIQNNVFLLPIFQNIHLYCGNVGFVLEMYCGLVYFRDALKL